MSIPIIDSHVHLFSESDLNKLRWMSPDNILASNHTVEEYHANNSDKLDGKFHVDGLIFIEADVISSTTDGDAGWAGPIEEAKFALSQVQKGPGNLKAVIPWAPLPQGKSCLVSYCSKLRQEVGDGFNMIKGFRYLVQDKPDKTMLNEDFIESLNWLGSQNLVFDLGIDLRVRGFVQFDEFLHVLSHTTNVTYILNHLAKPNLRIDPSAIDNTEFFQNWKLYLSKTEEICEKTGNVVYIKLSGVFSELGEDVAVDDNKIEAYVFPWIEYLVNNWDNSFIIWGSDWPVCNINGGTEAFHRWLNATEKCFDKLDVKRETREKIYSSNCFKAYNLTS